MHALKCPSCHIILSLLTLISLKIVMLFIMQFFSAICYFPVCVLRETFVAVIW
jgi:hypothetical protein